MSKLFLLLTRLPFQQYAPDDFLARRHLRFRTPCVIQCSNQLARQAHGHSFRIDGWATHFFHGTHLDFTTLCSYLIFMDGRTEQSWNLALRPRQTQTQRQGDWIDYR